MTEFSNSENPCKNCIVKAMCISSCDELNNFARKIISSEKIMSTWGDWDSYWFENYECRPRVKRKRNS